MEFPIILQSIPRTSDFERTASSVSRFSLLVVLMICNSANFHSITFHYNSRDRQRLYMTCKYLGSPSICLTEMVEGQNIFIEITGRLPPEGGVHETSANQNLWRRSQKFCCTSQGRSSPLRPQTPSPTDRKSHDIRTTRHRTTAYKLWWRVWSLFSHIIQCLASCCLAKGFIAWKTFWKPQVPWILFPRSLLILNDARARKDAVEEW